MAWAAALGAAGGLAGSALSGMMSYHSAKKLQQQNQRWQEKMSNTSHQREVKDLQAAGLNPVLSANSGASYGSVGNGVASIPDFGQDVNDARSLRMQEKQNDASVANTNADTHLKEKSWDLVDEQSKNAYEQGLNLMEERKQISANTAKSLQDIANSVRLTDAQVANLNSNSARNFADIQNLNVQTQAGRYGLPHKRLESDFWSSGYGKANYYTRETGNTARTWTGAVGDIIPRVRVSNQRYDDRSHHYVHNGNY